MDEPEEPYNPTADACPSFVGPFYEAMRTEKAALHPDLTPLQVIQALKDDWQTAHAQQMAAWQEHIIQRNQDHPPPPPDPPIPINERNKDLPPIPIGQPLNTQTLPDIPPQVMKLLRDRKYVPLWPFSREGILAYQHFLLQAPVISQTLTIESNQLKLGGTAEFRNGKFPSDLTLSLPNMLDAKNLYLAYLEDYEWPQNYVNILATFFFKIEQHPIRRAELPIHVVERTLIRYQAETRSKWFQAISNGIQAQMFDISMVLEKQIDRFSSEEQSRDLYTRTTVSRFLLQNNKP